MLPVAVAVALFGGSAAASDSGPPDADIRVGGKPLNLSPWTFSWTHETDEGGCVYSIGDGFPTWKPVGKVEHLHARPRIVLHDRARPRQVILRTSGRLREAGYLLAPNRLDTELQPRRRGGETVAWVVKFAIKVPLVRYVDAFVAWPDAGRCRGDRLASFDFKLKRD